jgi:capsular exopolysaccharide synthesis family protein
LVNYRDNLRGLQEEDAFSDMPVESGHIPESLFQILWRSRWYVFLAVVISLAAAFVYLYKTTPIFQSTSRIYVEQSGPKIITETEGVMTQSKNYLYTQAELLKSTPILADCLLSPGIKEMRTFTGVDNTIAYLKKQLTADVGKKDDIINVSFDSPYPTEAAQLVNAVVDSYITYHATSKRSTSAEVLKILQKEKDKRGKELTSKLQAVVDFKKENEALAFETGQGNIILDRLARLSEALTQAQLYTLEAKSHYEVIKTASNDPERLKQMVNAQQATLAFGFPSSQKARLNTELDQLELKEQDLLQSLTADHPAVKSIQAKISMAKEQITELDKQFVESQLAIAQQQYATAQEKENQIRSYLEEQRKQALSLNEQISQYALVQSELDQTKKLCDILDDRIKELSVTEDTGALNISILEVARPADKPSKPQKARIMGIALVLGLMLGAGLALLLSMLDHRLRSADEISAVLGVPVLGVIPSMSKKHSITERGLKVHRDSNSSVSEAYRTIRTSIFFGVPKGESTTILVTSPAPGDGKTTLVTNLAITMAQAGQKTIILDADFRRPMQHEIFKTDREKGLSSVIAGAVSMHEAIKPTGIDGLDLLTCGPEVPNPSEMINSKQFSDILQSLSEKYDRIVIDSPPVMPVTDSQILSAICDVTVVVLRADKSSRRTSQQARDGLESVGAHLLGAVVNDVSRRNGHYGYYGYGRYGYRHYGYYGKDKKKKTVAAAETE